MLREYDYVAAYGYLGSARAEKVLRSDDSTIFELLHSWDTAEASNVSSSEQDSIKRIVSGASCVVEEYADVRVFVYVGSNLL